MSIIGSIIKCFGWSGIPKHPSISLPRSPYGGAYVGPHNLLVMETPTVDTPEKMILVTSITRLDHRAYLRLKPGTPEWEEVLWHLVNAANQGIYNNVVSLGQQILAEAERAYDTHNQAKNRLRYLLGMVLGVLTVGILAVGTFVSLTSFLEPFIATKLLILLFLFAGIGSITSVLLRLSQIDLKDETSNFFVIISGFTKPIVAVFFAVIVYLILDMKIADIHFGSPPEAKRDGIYLVSAFLCGFSERFAIDILSRLDTSNKPMQKS